MEVAGLLAEAARVGLDHVLPLPGEPAREISTVVRSTTARHHPIAAARAALSDAAGGLPPPIVQSE